MTLSHIEAFHRGLDSKATETERRTRPPAREESSALATALSAAIEIGRSAFPSVTVDPERFLVLLGRCAREALGAEARERLPNGADVMAAIGSLIAADLYLACAAGQGDAAAIRIIIDTLVKPSVMAARRADDPSPFAEELTQVLRQKLLVAVEDAPPKILSFSGRAPLGAWIAVVVKRTVSTLRRSEGAREQFERRAAIEAEIIERDPELGYIKTHYADVFARAFEAALRKLNDRERSLLRLHNLHGVTLEQLATVYAVNDSTISRWLKQARTALVEETGRYMREDAGVTASEFASLARALTSQVDVSINRWLASAVKSAAR